MEELNKEKVEPEKKEEEAPKPRAKKKKKVEPKIETVPPMTRGQAIAYELIRRAKQNG